LAVSRTFTARVFAVPDPSPTPSGGWVHPDDCDLRPAVEYAFGSTSIAMRDEEPLGPCDDERHEVLVHRASAEDRIRGLDWGRFELCGAHLEQLLDIDDRERGTTHASRQALGTDRPHDRRTIPSFL
jgi:hypothetical protein